MLVLFQGVLQKFSLESSSQYSVLQMFLLMLVVNLKKFAKDILGGDFSSFLELDKIVKDRARIAAFQKWGKKAEEFGWTV